MNCIHAKTIYTGTSIVRDAHLLFEGSRLAGISKTKTGKLLGRFDVLTPAFIDPHSHIGMHRSGEPESEGETNEHMQPILAVPDALDSVQMDDTSFRDAIEAGVLYSCVVPGSGNIIGGLSAIIRHYSKNSSDALIGRAGVKAAFGYNPMSTVSWKGERPSTRMGALAILRAKLDDVRQKMEKHKSATGEKKKEITFSAAEIVLRDILAGKHVLRAHVHKIDDIATLLRVADEFKLRVTVEHAGDVHQPEIFRELKKRGIPVMYGPIDGFAYKVELKHDSWRNVLHLVKSGVEYGLMTDHPFCLARQLFPQTRWFTRAGLSKQQAIELVSRKNAELIGIDKMLGTLDKGKWASFVCWSGDPFDMVSYPQVVYGEGELLFSE
ncbi:MAG: amidohydrolase family protein [Candidatus Eisenbacteria bacterium]|nr:amidohydrolase family protein [Candidatus Eisenbacteria bacterium]